MKCRFCEGKCIRKGKVNGIQKYKCKDCLKYQQCSYKYQSYTVTDQQLITLTKEGLGIRSTSRILSISPKTGIERLKKIGDTLKRKSSFETGREYEVDELSR